MPSGVTAERVLTVGAMYGRVGREHGSEEERPPPPRQLGHCKGLSLDHWFSSGAGGGVRLCPLGDIWQLLETPVLVSPGRGAGHLGVRDQGCCSEP